MEPQPHSHDIAEDCSGCARAAQPVSPPPAVAPRNPAIEALAEEIVAAFPVLEFTRTGRTRERASDFLRALLARALDAERERLANLIDALAGRDEVSAVRSVYSAIRLSSATVRAGG